MSVRVGLLGMYSSANLGDTAIQAMIMAELRRRVESLEFVGITSDPLDAVDTFGINAFHSSGNVDEISHSNPNRHSEYERPNQKKSLLKIYRYINTLDALVVSGGGQLDDFWGGPWEQPIRLLAWCVSARLTRRRLAAFALGVDDLQSSISKTLVRWAISLAGMKSFRDKGSRTLLFGNQAMGKDAIVIPDPAFAVQQERALRSSTVTRAILSPISQRSFGNIDDACYTSYIESCARLGDELVSRGIEVLFTSTQIRMDPQASELVRARMEFGAATSTRCAENYGNFVDLAANADLIVTSRLHGVILAAVANCPIVAVSPARKVTQQMIDLGLANYTVEMANIERRNLVNVALDAINNRQVISETLGERVARLRVQVTQSFDDLADLITLAHPE